MKMRTKITFILVGVLIFSSCTSTYLGRYIVWNFPKADDYKKMPFRIVKKSTKNVFVFDKKLNNNLFSNMELGYKNKNYKGKFNDYLDVIGTNSFVVIKNDTIIYEKYFNNFADSTISLSFSVTKSITSALIGIAISRHYISSLDDKIIKYIPDIDSAKFGDISIRSLLNMSSGLTINHNYLPWNGEPKTYHSPDIRNLTLTHLEKAWQTDKHFYYNNYNTFLLGIILENTTHMSITAFIEEYLWSQIGTSNNALFCLDSKRHGFEKVETGMTATAIDFAKFGRLYLNNGNWNGKQIIPKDWIALSSSIDTNFIKNDYYSEWMNTNKIAYRNAWWQRYDNKKCHTYWADGLLGQFIWIYPQKKLIIVRLGKENGGIDWYSFLNNVTNQI
jgi:CubicO group peptidase (beta-lactamase class C family)